MLTDSKLLLAPALWRMLPHEVQHLVLKDIRALAMELTPKWLTGCREHLPGIQLTPTHTQSADTYQDEPVPATILLLQVPSETQTGLQRRQLEMVRRHAGRPIIGLFCPSHSSAQFLLRLGASGVTEVIELESLTQWDALGDALLGARHAVAVGDVQTALADAGDEELVTSFTYALDVAMEAISVATLGARLGLHERSLRKRCAAAHVPSPQRLIGWARVLLACHYMRHPRWSLAQVAALLRFSTPETLRAHLRRYTRVPLQMLRGPTGVQHAARRCALSFSDHRRRSLNVL